MTLDTEHFGFAVNFRSHKSHDRELQPEDGYISLAPGEYEGSVRLRILLVRNLGNDLAGVSGKVHAHPLVLHHLIGAVHNIFTIL